MDLDLSIIIVSWNVVDRLNECLRSIFDRAILAADGTLHIGRHTAEVYVVDNASADSSVAMVRGGFPQAKLIASSKNLGFTKGNNLALSRCQGRNILLLNPDAYLTDEAIARMLDYMETNPDVGVLGPKMFYGDGTYQSSRRRFPTLLTALMESTLLEQWFPRNRWVRAYRMADTPDGQTQDVDWVMGACMLVRGEAVQCVGVLDERFFMYSEELDWCRRIARAGWRIVYLPGATVVHHEGQSSDQAAGARHIHFETSKVLYFRKHHGAFQGELLRYFLLATYRYRLVEEALKGLLGSKRPLRRERIHAYRQVLLSGLRPRDLSAEERSR